MPLIKPLGRALKKFYNKTPDFKNYWWITTSIPGEDSAEINLTNALANKDFNKLVELHAMLHRNCKNFL